MTTPRKAKRKLSDISFDHEGAHVALVSKQQGGPANGHDYALVLKANNYSKEFIQKVQQVKVTMELPDFLEKFFYLYGSEVDMLAAMMGYVEPAEKPADEMQSWIEERMSAFEIVKSLHDSENLSASLVKLTEEEFLSVLKDQETLEKAFAAIEAKKNAATPEGAAKEGATEAVAKAKESEEMKVEPSATKPKGNVNMDELEAVQKALDAQKEELNKALAKISEFEAKEKEAVAKARFDLVKDAVKDEAKATVLFKALSLVEDEAAFKEVLKTLADMQSLVDKSELFKETGANVEVEETPEVSSVTKVLKAKYQPKK